MLPGGWVQAKLNQTLFPEGVFGPREFKIDVTFGPSPEDNDDIHGFVRGPVRIPGDVEKSTFFFFFPPFFHA